MLNLSEQGRKRNIQWRSKTHAIFSEHIEMKMQVMKGVEVHSSGVLSLLLLGKVRKSSKSTLMIALRK
jgi:hypothetical protein